MSVPLPCVLCVSCITHFSDVVTQNRGQVPFQVTGNSLALCDLKSSSEMVKILFDDIYGKKRVCFYLISCHYIRLLIKSYSRQE